LSAAVGFASTYASYSTVCPLPKSGIRRRPKYLYAVASKIGRTRRSRNVLDPGATGPAAPKNRASDCT
jgi:hypothetical protein